ncbi:MAG TPA: hypothetical protein PKA64_18760, partial [Myxococcota bacterium]|nr:hypothetical protein [Myxococcota bacterium]
RHDERYQQQIDVGDGERLVDQGAAPGRTSGSGVSQGAGGRRVAEVPKVPVPVSILGGQT